MKNDRAADTATATITAVKRQGAAAIRAVFQRRHMILGSLALLLVAGMLALLVTLLPRSAKPANYKAGELTIQSLTQVVGYRKVLGMTESLSGLGRMEAGEYTYKTGKNPMKDTKDYVALLCDKYEATVNDGAQIGMEEGSVTLLLPTGLPDKQVALSITYNQETYKVAVGEKKKPVQKPLKADAAVTPEQARELLLTLTKAETGFKSDISVYTSKLEEETVNVDGWDYYVFTVIADYSATRIEYRGTFYISCHDGAILRYDKDAKTTSRVRNPE